MFRKQLSAFRKPAPKRAGFERHATSLQKHHSADRVTERDAGDKGTNVRIIPNPAPLKLRRLQFLATDLIQMSFGRGASTLNAMCKSLAAGAGLCEGPWIFSPVTRYAMS